MVQERTCDYTGEDIEPGTGTMYVQNDGTILWFKDSKARKNYMMGRESRDLEWIGYEEDDETEAVEADSDEAEVEEAAEEEDDTEEAETADAEDDETADAEAEEAPEADAEGEEDAEEEEAEA